MTYDELIESILTAQEMMLQHSIEANSVTLNGKKYGKLIENLPPNMKPTVFGMAVKADYSLPDDYDLLVQYEPPQPMTNADKIRAMSDEQLNAWFMGVCHAVAEFSCSGCQFEYLYGEDCGFLSWLKKEASDDSFVHTGP